MDWQAARQQIKDNVTIGTDVNTEVSLYRVVKAVDCSGFTVRIGIRESNRLRIPWEMLETCFAQLNTTAGYSGQYFRQQYPKEAMMHPTYVHVLGQIFVRSGIARRVTKKVYKTKCL